LKCNNIIRRSAKDNPPKIEVPPTPTLPETTNAPVETLEEAVVFDNVMIPLLPKVVTPETLPFSVKFAPDRLPPTLRLPPIPTPPVTTNAPVDVELEMEELDKTTLPVAVNVETP